MHHLYVKSIVDGWGGCFYYMPTQHAYTAYISTMVTLCLWSGCQYQMHYPRLFTCLSGCSSLKWSETLWKAVQFREWVCSTNKNKYLNSVTNWDKTFFLTFLFGVTVYILRFFLCFRYKIYNLENAVHLNPVLFLNVALNIYTSCRLQQSVWQKVTQLQKAFIIILERLKDCLSAIHGTNKKECCSIVCKYYL